MKIRSQIYLTGDLCYCRLLTIPPVSSNEVLEIIKYKLISFYPGSIEDLYIDYIEQKDSVLVFYIQKEKVDEIKKTNSNIQVFSAFHLLQDLENKEGAYCISINKRLEYLVFENNQLTNILSLPDNDENRLRMKNEDLKIKIADILSPPKANSLFLKKRKSNYLLQILIFLVLIIITPQLFYGLQIRKEGQYLENLEREIKLVSVEYEKLSTSESQLNDLKEQYNSIILKKPLVLYYFLSDLSRSLGTDTDIESLSLKGRNFQMNATGYNPLKKMEEFQKNPLFKEVIPYQVQSIRNTNKERFSISGIYTDE